MPAKDRATAFIAAFQSLPTPDDMAAELTRLGLDQATVTGPAGKDGKATSRCWSTSCARAGRAGRLGCRDRSAAPTRPAS